MSAAHFEIVDTAAGFHVRLRAANGEIVMTSEVYTDRRAAERAIEVVGEATLSEVVREEKP